MIRCRGRPRAVLVAIAVATFTAIGGSRVARAQLADEPIWLETLKSLLEAGRYSDAETEAERLYRESPATNEDQHLAGDLLVEALTRNGRGAEPRTLELAEGMVRVRSASDPAQPE